jgi:hypothetical protein
MQNYSYSDANATNKKARLGGSRAVTLSRCDNLGGVVAQVDRKINNRCKCVKVKKARHDIGLSCVPSRPIYVLAIKRPNPITRASSARNPRSGTAARISAASLMD